jgi:hypothetical protein
MIHKTTTAVVASEAKQSRVAKKVWIASSLSLLAMTGKTTASVIPGRAQREPGISCHTSRFRIGPLRGPSGTTANHSPHCETARNKQEESI